MPSFSVLTPTHNRSRTFLEDCITSVQNQVGIAAVQHIVINNASTDDTQAHLHELAAIYPSLVIINSVDNLGPGGALNLALPQVTGDYLWPLDDDDQLLPQSLQLQHDFLHANPEVAMAFGYAEPIDEHGQIITSPELAGFNAMQYSDDLDTFFKAHLAANQLKNGTVVLRTKAVRQLGGWSSLTSCQDWDLTLGMLHSERVYRRNPVSVSRYRIHAEQLSTINSVNGIWLQKAIGFQAKYGRG